MICDGNGTPPPFDVLLPDKGYASEAFRQAYCERGTEPIIAKRKISGVKGALHD